MKPHGALYVQCWESPELAAAVAKAQVALGAGTLLYAFDMRQRDAAAGHGVTLVQEAFVDLWYDGEGHLLLERAKLACDPELAGEPGGAARAGAPARDEGRQRHRIGAAHDLPARRRAPQTGSTSRGPYGKERVTAAGIRLQAVRDDLDR